MKTFVILLSFVVCCVTAGRLTGLTQKLQWLENIREGEDQGVSQYQSYTYGDVKQRQQFLLDVLLQVQKPLVNTELIQMGKVLVTEPNMYIQPNDVILQEFLQQARNQQILGRNDVYNPVDITHVRQLVGLQRFFVLARDFKVFQRNVAYARLYCNAVMFVDALTLAIRERPDTQDLVMPPMNEILPQMYYDNYVLYSAQNVDFEKLFDQAASPNAKYGLSDFYGSLFSAGKHSSREKSRGGKKGSQKGDRRMKYSESGVDNEIVLPVENQAGLATELTTDIQLDVAWKNIIMDQLAQTATEGIECGQQISGIGYGQQYYPYGQKSQYQRGGIYDDQQQKYGEQGGRYGYGIGYQGYGTRGQYKGQSVYQVYGDYDQDYNDLPQVSANDGRLLPVGHNRRVGGYSNYVNPFYQYGYGDQDYGTYGSYGSYGQYYGGQQKYQRPTQYGYKKQQYGAYYDNDDQQYQRQYGYGKGQEYGSSYTRPYGRQHYDDAQYGYNNQKYGSYYDNEGKKYQGSQYGYNKDQESGSYINRPYGRQGAQYDYNNQKYGSYYDNEGQKYQGSQYGYNKDQEYGSYINRPYGRQGAQYDYNNQKYGSPYDNEGKQYRGQKYDQEYDTYYASRYGGGPARTQGGPQYGYKDQQYGYGAKVQNQYQQGQQFYGGYGQKGVQGCANYRYKELYRYLQGWGGQIGQCIAATKQLSYERRGEILLRSIQELAARFNIERYVEDIEGNRHGQQQQQCYHAQQQITQLMQQMRTLIEQVCEERGVSKSSEATLNIVADIINGRLILQQQQHSNTVQRQLQMLQQQIVNILGYQVGPVNEVTPLALLFGNLRDPCTQQIICSFADLITYYRQQLQPYTQQQLIANAADITVQNVQIDPLITYTEYYDADLINLLDQQLLQSNTNNLQRLSQKVVARQQRVNHQPFTIAMDIASERSQEVSVRILMVPQIGYEGYERFEGRRGGSLEQNQQNCIVLDAFVRELQPGSNYIQRSSRQFNGYNNDVTTISQLYRQLMTGQVSEKYLQSGTIRQLPRNLLLPRGTAVKGGLPVQILVVVTPLTQQDRQSVVEGQFAQQISGLGIAGVAADQLPLGYPLDRQIYDEESLNVPNVQLIKTTIQYDVRSRA